MFIPLFLITFFSTTYAITYSDRQNYDAYGTLVASTDTFVVLAQNDVYRYGIFMAPFGLRYMCTYSYSSPNNFVINIAVNRRQNSSKLSFVYLVATSADGYTQKVGIFTFAKVNLPGTSISSCRRILQMNEGEHDARIWNRPPSELSTLQVDLDGKYAYGFLSDYIFIYDIYNNVVKDLSWNDTFPSISFSPHALDIGETSDGISMAILAGYYLFDPGKALPAVYLVRLDPPNNIILVDNYTIISDNQKFVRAQYAFTYQFEYVMSVSIHDATKQVMVAIPQLNNIYRFSFTSTHLTLLNVSSYPARSTAWLDESGTQVGLLLNSVTTPPWAQSQVQVVNISSNSIMYAYPNTQQTLTQWSTTTPSFLRLILTHDSQLAILTNDGTVVLIPSTDAGYYKITDDINNDQNRPQPCPSGTYKSIRSAAPCTICPMRTKSSPNNVTFNSSSGMDIGNPTTYCTSCSVDSFCPLGSVVQLNRSHFRSISQAFAYPNSATSTSFDDILMQNTFSLQSQPRRCLVISPFFWAIITLIIAFVMLLIMGLLYYSPSGVKHYHQLESVFRHSDLIGNGELWFGGLISFAIIVLITYGFWFGAVFAEKYPIETATDADFACDPTLRNTQFSSSLQLLATIKSDAQKPIFDMLDNQTFTLTVTFIQTGYSCHDLATQENIGTYSVSLPIANCTEQPENATLIATYQLPHHEMTVQINLNGSYYIGALLICLTGPNSTRNDSTYVVKEMNYCELFGTLEQTIGQTTSFYFGITKVINETAALDYSGSADYSGIWIPTSTHGSLDDHIIYSQRGNYLRYLSTQHTVIITLSETNFYISNQQQPIARTGEVIFHNILFTTTIIGIFTLAFVIFKLTFMPILLIFLKRPTMLCCYARKPKEPKVMEEVKAMEEVEVMEEVKAAEDRTII